MRDRNDIDEAARMHLSLEDRANALYEKFTGLFGPDECVRDLFMNIVLKAKKKGLIKVEDDSS